MEKDGRARSAQGNTVSNKSGSNFLKSSALTNLILLHYEDAENYW